jgi:hypothetical protein
VQTPHGQWRQRGDVAQQAEGGVPILLGDDPR